MKKIIIVVILSAITFFGVLTGCTKKPVIDKYLNKYEMNIELEDNLASAKLNQKISFKNTNGLELTDIRLNLYANAYRKDSHYKAYANNIRLSRYGGIEIINVNINGVRFDYSLELDKTILVIPKTVEIDEVVAIEISAIIAIPITDLRFGFYAETLNFANFYPILCVYESTGYRQDHFTRIGDPFYSDVANYDVNITCNNKLMVAVSGKKTDEKISELTNTYSYKLENARDFALVASYKFKTMQTSINKTKIDYYYMVDATPEESLQTAVNAVNVFSKAFGDYPYPTLAVVETAFQYGGMEYPALIMISNKEIDNDAVIVHETAHQWWNVVVGSDSINHSWQDEGLTTFSTNYYHLLMGDSEKFIELQSYDRKSYTKFMVLQSVNSPNYIPLVDKPIYNFASSYEYTLLAYVRANLMFDAIYTLVGRQKFEQSLRTYYKNNAFTNATQQDLFDAFSQTTKNDTTNLFRAWLDNKVVSTFSIA